MAHLTPNALGLIGSAVDGYSRTGIKDLPKSRRSSRYVYNLLCFLGCLSGISYATLYAALGLWPMVGLALWVATTVSLPFIAILSERVSVALGVAIICTGFTALTYLAGRESLLHFYLITGVVIIAILRGARSNWDPVIAAAFCAGCMVWCQLYFVEPALGDAISPGLVSFLAAGVILMLSGLSVLVLVALSRQVAYAQEALAAEHARSEALLDNLLPTEIAARLKSAPGEIIADDLPAVTILFADIVDFTPRASSMPPEDVVRFLNSVFTEFDRLTDRFGLEKIKTIGDAYMVAAGMPRARPDHAQAVAELALEMLSVTERMTEASGQSVEVRIGLHSGAAIAGVIGTQKVFYDVWGDTVNTASRMESHGAVGRIQLTEETKALLGDAYLFERRGEVEIKGKGRLTTYWLVGRAAL